LVAQGFLQNLLFICEKTYSLVLDIAIFDYPSCTTRSTFIFNDDVTTYLYGDSLENDINMKIPKLFNLSNKANSKEGYSIKLNMSFYWLKQSRRLWYNCLIEMNDLENAKFLFEITKWVFIQRCFYTSRSLYNESA